MRSEKYRNKVEVMTAHIRDLSAITRILYEADLLWAEEQENKEPPEPAGAFGATVLVDVV